MVNIQTKTKDQSLTIFDIPLQMFRAARPIHWTKNLAIFAALIFTGNLFQEVPFARVFFAFIVFNFATSATYVFNDIIDRNIDRLHPTKKNRPVASGKLPVIYAFFELLALALVALYLASWANHLLFVTVITYFTLQVFYSLILKNLSTIDILAIASGFVIRIYAGALVINAHLSVWFLLCVISVALFLASGKRRAELNLIKLTRETTRKSLTQYRKELLNSYVTMFGNASWMSWALFTFFESPQSTVPVWLLLAELSRTTAVNKLLMLTIPIVIFGIMRYESLIFEGKSEAPEKLLLTDMSLVISVFAWTILVIWILYGGITLPGSTF